MVELRALGPLELRDDAGPLATVLTQPKRAALLAYLALARPRQLHRRDTLLALFWPDLDDAHARNALSQALSFLRRELPEGVLVTRGSEEVGVGQDRLVCDVVEFEDAVDGDRWDQALMLYRGELLAGLHVADAPGFERWHDTERDRLRERAAGAAWSLAEHHLEAGEPVEAERAAQRALQLSPTDESPVRAFVEALARAGDRAASLRFYEKFRTLLAEELDVEPASETAAVAAAVRKGEVRAEVRAGRPKPGSGAEAAPESGRSGWPAPYRGEPTPADVSSSREWGRGRGARAVLVAAGILLAIVVGILETRSSASPGTLLEEGLAERYDRVVVADFAASFDPGLGRAAAEWLRAELDQSDIIRPVEPGEIGAALRRMQRDPSLPLDAVTAREIAVRDGYPLVVVGEIKDVGESCLATVRLESAEGAVLGRFRAAAAVGDGLVAELDRMGGEIRARIGESRASIRRNRPLEQVTTASLDALRLYTDAVRIMTWEGRNLDAIPLLERVLEVDSTFAAAYFYLSRAVQDVPDWGRRDELNRKAYEHREHLSDYERLMTEEAHRFSSIQADTTHPPDECDLYGPLVPLFEAYIRQHPDDVRPLATYGVYLERSGRAEKALDVYRNAIEEGRLSTGVINNLFSGLVQRRRFDEAEPLLDLWRNELGESYRLVLARMSASARKADYEETDSLYSLYQERYGPEPDISAAQGRIDALRGRMREAWAHFDDGIDHFERRGLLLGMEENVLARAFIRLNVLADTGAVGPVEAWLARLPPDTLKGSPWISIGVLRALAGDATGAQLALDTLVATNRRNWSGVRGPLRASIALAEGRSAAALAHLEESTTPCSFSRGQDVADLRFRRILAGRAHEALGEPTLAIADYQDYLRDPPVSYPIGLDAIFLLDTLERLGRLHDQLGHDDEAIAYYARAADLWADADPELQPRVRALRERAAVLVGEG